MRERMAWACVAAGGALTFSLEAFGRPPFPYAGTFTVGLLTAYANSGAAVWTRQRRWTAAGLTLLTGAVAAAESGATGDLASVTTPSAALLWVIGRFLLLAGTLALAAGLLWHSGLPERRERLLPALLFALLVLLAGVKATEIDRLPSLADSAMIHLSLVVVVMFALGATGVAVNAALAGPRRLVVAGLGLLPVATLLAGALLTVDADPLFTGSTGSAYSVFSGPAQEQRLGTDAALDAALREDIVRNLQANVRAASQEAVLYAEATTTSTEVPGPGEGPGPALARTPDLTDHGDTWLAFQVAFLLAGLAAIVTAIFPPARGEPLPRLD
ncbi:hypothetical protein ACTOB_005688 [Actinoplanes oblitus]|uniref:Copper resistance protein D domain-containing protein n=1 Tax=Actinoplanes oblitus TaxID=3040509 RepID=A0ABY8WB75_9ACTN|nr:hypothetical protein [Actinoplanes oblitus]WIM93703.1 hypothetical protein ACTOB_005688 [Actinoplanes oblitus]